MFSPVNMTTLFTRLSLGSRSAVSFPSGSTRLLAQKPTAAAAAAASHYSPPLFNNGSQQQRSSLHTTAIRNAGRGGKKKRSGPQRDPRIKNLKMSMPRRVPAPLRFGRNRALRHWTIHRAWMLHQRNERERRERELMRMYQSMSNACEELRKTSGPGTRDEGYLYRVAMEKKGVFGHGGIPIEYTRMQTETPARQAWNHDWKR